jgi:hypothetical protein
MGEYVPQPPGRRAIAREWLAHLCPGKPAQDDRPFVIVTGAGRSGTSAVARVLHESGVSMGDKLAEPTDANADGFYEDWGPLWVNERILLDGGLGDRWHPERWPSRAKIRAAARRYQDEMAALVANAAGGWKDPRFSITLESWLPLVPRNVSVVVCLRSPAAYADSVVRLYGLVDRAAAEQQWARHYRRLLDVIRNYGLRAICLEYDALIEHPAETVGTLASFVGRSLSPEHVNAPLRRYVRDVPVRHRELYGEVQRLSPQSLWSAARIAGRPRAPEAAGAPDAARIATTAADVQRARHDWGARVRMPRPVASAATVAACEAYRSVLCEAQRELAALEPLSDDVAPLLRDVNLQRMIVELTLSAIRAGGIDKRALQAAARAWRRFGRPANAPAPSA